MTKVTIIVPFHNVENYISECLDSLVNQTLKDIEIICIDDASTDGSKYIVEKYKSNDERIKILNTQEPSGQSYARNLGLDEAQGEYIGFVDSDDRVELDMFEKMYDTAKKDDTDITMCRALLFDDKEKNTYSDDYYGLMPLENFKDRVFHPNDTKDEILNINVVLWNKIYKREFLRQINAKFQNGYIYEDLPFFFETYLKAQRVNILWENMYYYRQNRIYSTMQNSDKKVYDRIPMVELTYKILQTADFYKEKKLDIISWMIDDIFHRYTVLEDKYYEDYYSSMKKFFESFDLTEEEKLKLDTSYCYDEFCNVLDRTYYGFWQFLIEKYKTSNKLIKTIKHEHNESMRKIHEYWDEYSIKAEQEKKDLTAWWQNHYDEDMQKQQEIIKDKEEAHQAEITDYQNRMTNQEYELKAWQAESVRQTTEKLTADYEWKLQEQKNHYELSLQNQKYYYENNFLLVKILLKVYTLIEKIKNKIKRLNKKN